LKLSFHGADRGVTGSCHLVEAAGRSVLIDCGLFQGGREMDEENGEPLGFDPAAIDYLLLTPCASRSLRDACRCSPSKDSRAR
jgi:metallo-beta-lactamase family protein